VSGASAGAPRPTVRAPLGWTVLVAAFLLAPLWAVGGDLGTNPLDDHRLRELARDAFAGWFGTGEAGRTPALAHLVETWRSVHLVKAVAAGLILPAAVGCRRRARTRGGRVLAVASGTIASVALVANIQGTVAPLASLASALDQPAPPTLLAWTHSAAWPALLDDFAAYHWAMVVLAGLAATAGAVAAYGTARRRRRVATAALTTWTLAWALLTVANASTALQPEPALLAALGGAS
jgi:hypothetical protein